MTKKEIKIVLYNIFGVKFIYKCKNQFTTEDLSIMAYYYKPYINIYFYKENYDFIKQKLIGSKEIYEYDLYNIDGLIYLCNSLKNIDI